MAKKRTKPEAPKEFYSVSEVAEIVGITSSLVSRYCRKGFQRKSVGQKIGRNYIVPHADMVLIRDSARTVGRPKSVAAE